MLLRVSLDSNIWLWMLRLWLRVIFAWLFQCKVFAAEPSFHVPPVNVTVIEGDVAVLPCSIQHLTDEHKVVWTDGKGFVLTLNDKRVLDDTRLSVERPFKNLWNLHIRDVTFADRGTYVCQINTMPAKSKNVQLDVLIPPHIIEQYSSKEKITVSEGETVTLVCNATGYPQPEIRWFRYTSESMGLRERIGKNGEVLIVHNVSRDCGGAYICEADNNVDEIQTRKIEVNVQYPPEVTLPVARLGQHKGKETFLQCKVTANPHAVMSWKRGKLGDLANAKYGRNENKYVVEIYDSDDTDGKIISLRIREITDDDFGEYTCHAENFVGRDTETMVLYDYGLRDRKMSTTTERSLVVQPPVIFNRDNNRDTHFNNHPHQPPLFESGDRENTGAIRGFSTASTITDGPSCHVMKMFVSVLALCIAYL